MLKQYKIYYICSVKTILLTILSLFYITKPIAQVIDINNFNEKLFEKILFDEIIEFRKSIGKDSLVWSDVLYHNISKPNTEKMIDENRLFHPEQSEIWKDNKVRTQLANELVVKQKVQIIQSTISGPMFTLSEIAARIPYNLVTTYQDLALFVIKGWDESEGHREIQRMKMINDNTLAMSSCSVKLSKDKLNFFIEFDFAIPYCVK